MIAAVRARGCIAHDARDAAHEAHHAISALLFKPWTRDNINAALKKHFKRRELYAYDEILARAVEQLVCADLGVDTYDVESGALIAVQEAAAFGEATFPYADFVRAVKELMANGIARRSADRVLRLVKQPGPTEQPASPRKRTREKKEASHAD